VTTPSTQGRPLSPISLHGTTLRENYVPFDTPSCARPDVAVFNAPGDASRHPKKRLGCRGRRTPFSVRLDKLPPSGCPFFPMSNAVERPRSISFVANDPGYVTRSAGKWTSLLSHFRDKELLDRARQSGRNQCPPIAAHSSRLMLRGRDSFGSMLISPR
jgi:hypothetical protein